MTDKEYSEFLHSAVFREYEKRIDDHFRATDARALSDRQAWEREFKSLSEALRLQASEYERRLTVLNHAHEQAIQAQAMTVPREMFNQTVKDNEAWKAEFSRWRDTVNGGLMTVSNLSTRIGDYENFKLSTSAELKSNSAKATTWTAAIGLLFVVITVILQIVMRGK